MELRFYIPLDAEHVISQTSSQPISWLGTEETRPNITTANMHKL